MFGSISFNWIFSLFLEIGGKFYFLRHNLSYLWYLFVVNNAGCFQTF